MEKGTWVPLIQYAVQKGISISTLRRRIRANEIKYQLRNGRYFIYDDGQEVQPQSFQAQEHSQKVISDLQEQVADLKTLVQVLEAKLLSP